VVLACLLFWVLEDALGNVPKSFPNHHDSIKNAKQAGIAFDLAFINRLTDSFHLAQRLNIDLMRIWKFLPTLNLSELLEKDFLGTWIQNLLPQHLRKALAANYSSLVSAQFLAALSFEEDIEKVIDPFSGSGRLLTALNEEYSYRKLLKRPSIAFNELLDLAAYLAAVQIIFLQRKQNKNPLITLHFGDAFSKLKPPFEFENKADEYFEKTQMIIMNPPFTRYLRLSNQYLETLNNVCKNYAKYMSPQMGLHVFSLFLADSLLLPGGRIAAILPAPTFYSEYSEGLKDFLLARYHIRAIIGTSTDKSFSEASDLKEIIFIADKRKKGEKPIKSVLFATINEELTHDNFRTIANSIWEEKTNQFDVKLRRVSHNELKRNWNWIRFLEHEKIHALAEILIASPKICSATPLNLRIIRGFEMYGPDFFFLPNRDWLKEEETSGEIVFYHIESQQSLRFSREVLLPALRKPSLYSRSVSPSTHHYILRVPEGYKENVPPEYIEERRPKWRVAEARFGEDWLHHIDQQLNSKKPFGYLFTVDKFGITTTGTIIHYFDEEMTASKNFYVIDCNQQTAKLLAAWMSSTFFILMFLAARREIGGPFGRLQIIDYLREPIFLDVTNISKALQQLILSKFDEFRLLELPPLRDQIGWKPRNELDHAILNALQIEGVTPDEFLQEVYTAILKAFEEADFRGKKRRGRE
jgi:hypothetical protein